MWELAKKENQDKKTFSAFLSKEYIGKPTEEKENLTFVFGDLIPERNPEESEVEWSNTCVSILWRHLRATVEDWKKSLEEDFQSKDWLYTQTEVTPVMRFSLLDWMIKITRTLDFSLETWCLAVNYVDRFLSKQLIGKDCLQLVGVTALWLGAKQEELLPPTLDQLVALCADTYSAIYIKHMELLLLAELKFRLAAPTPAYHLHHLIAVEEEKDWSDEAKQDCSCSLRGYKGEERHPQNF